MFITEPRPHPDLNEHIAANWSEVDMANITGTSGDDELTGTYGSDTYYTSGVLYGDTYYDPGGDDHYVLGSTGLTIINDAGGTDVATLAGYDLADLNFMVLFDSTVAFWTEDSAVCVWFEGMINNPSGGLDYLVLDDVTLTRADILTYSDHLFGIDYLGILPHSQA